MPMIHKIPVSYLRNELRRRNAIQYLRSRRIYRGDIRCRHSYEPHNPDALRDHSIIVTVCRMPNAAVNVATRSA